TALDSDWASRPLIVTARTEWTTSARMGGRARTARSTGSIQRRSWSSCSWCRFCRMPLTFARSSRSWCIRRYWTDQSCTRDRNHDSSLFPSDFQRYRVDGIAAGDEQRSTVVPAEHLVRRERRSNVVHRRLRFRLHDTAESPREIVRNHDSYL